MPLLAPVLHYQRPIPPTCVVVHNEIQGGENKGPAGKSRFAQFEEKRTENDLFGTAILAPLRPSLFTDPEPPSR